ITSSHWCARGVRRSFGCDEGRVVRRRADRRRTGLPVRPRDLRVGVPPLGGGDRTDGGRGGQLPHRVSKEREARKVMSHTNWCWVDLDGVLAKYDTWKGLFTIGEPFPGARKFMHDLMKLGEAK